MPGHWWQVVRHDTDPSGRDTLWRCRRCGSETKFWKEPDPGMKVPVKDDSDFLDDEDEKFYTCEELIVRVVHES